MRCDTCNFLPLIGKLIFHSEKPYTGFGNTPSKEQARFDYLRLPTYTYIKERYVAEGIGSTIGVYKRGK